MFQSLFVCFNCLSQSSCRLVGIAEVVETSLVVRLELKGLLEIGDCFRKLVALLVGVGKIEVASGVVRKLFGDLHVFLDRLLEIVVLIELLSFVK